MKLKEVPNAMCTPLKPNTFGVRHIQALFMLFGTVIGYFQRVNISAAIVPMTQSTAGAVYYDWTPSTKSLILSSFFWGYVVAQVPAGLLAKRYGAQSVLGYSTAGAAILAILHPLGAEHGGWICICVLRVLTGLLQGSLHPCLHTLLAKWVPLPERSFLTTIIYSGAQLGTTLILATSGFIFDSSMGWPGLFYVSGGLSLFWAIMFLCFGANEPAQARFITKDERDYIESLTGSGENSQAMTVPWKKIFTSRPFYALLVAHCGFSWGFFTLLTEMPTYLSKVLKLNVKSNALLSALPYCAMWLMGFVTSPLSDMLINRGYLKITTARKTFNSIGQLLPMICLIALGYITAEEKVLAITLLTLAVGFNSGSACGFLVNHMDLSPNFAGPMMSITNCVSGLLTIIAPIVVGVIVTAEEDPNQWRIVFFITAAVYFVCNLIFVVFGKATVQTWNESTHEKNLNN